METARRDEIICYHRNSVDDLETWYRRRQEGLGNLPSRQVRDLTLIQLGRDFSLVVAVDSDGGIGGLAHDTVKVAGYVVGRFALRVPLMELMCSGATPLAAFDMLTVPMDAYGAEIVRGIREELQEAGLPATFPLSGSTEDNVATAMTGVGTTVLGVVREDDFRPGSSSSGDAVFCIGLPKSAPEDEIAVGDPQIVGFSDVRLLLDSPGVHDLLPVGSRGIAHEATQMAASARLRFVPAAGVGLNLRKSAGPCTCILLSAAEAIRPSVRTRVRAPVTEIGSLRE